VEINNLTKKLKKYELNRKSKLVVCRLVAEYEISGLERSMTEKEVITRIRFFEIKFKTLIHLIKPIIVNISESSLGKNIISFSNTLKKFKLGKLISRK
jgi:hypothetical protein